MKKKLALLLASVMIIGMLPVTAMATTNRISRVVSVTQDDHLDPGDQYLNITDDDNDWRPSEKFSFTLSLSGARWSAWDASATPPAYTRDETVVKTAIEAALVGRYTDKIDNVTVQKLSDSIMRVDVEMKTSFGSFTEDPRIQFPMLVQVTGASEATVTISGVNNAQIYDETLTIATVVSGSATVSIEGTTTIRDTATQIKSLIVKENVAKTLNDGSELRIKLSGNFEFAVKETSGTVTNITGFTLRSVNTDAVNGDQVTGAIATNSNGDDKIDEDNIYVDFDVNYDTTRAEFLMSGIYIVATNDAKTGDECYITVSGGGVNSNSILVGTFKDYGTEVTVESKDLPVLYSGKVNDVEDRTLKLTLKENVANSWLINRKTTFTFPEEVRPVSTKITVDKSSVVDVSSTTGWTFDKNVATYTNSAASTNRSSGAEVVLRFVVNVEPGYEGNITCVVGGTALEGDTEVVLATAKNPFTVESTANEVIIDYRETPINDIIVTEAAPGVFTKNGTVRLAAEYLTFESDGTYEIVEGDIKLSSVKQNGGNIDIKISSESTKTPAVIKLSNLSLYMNRSLPAGTYKLYTAIASTGSPKTSIGFENYTSASNKADEKENGLFNTEDYVVLDELLDIITSGRENNSGFTKTIVVTIGSATMTAGSATIALDAPAYIKDGYTMMPLRAVTEALSDGTAQVGWHNDSRTVTLHIDSSRIVKMVIGENVMTINGTTVPMSTAAEISNERTFIPLRDLGYALGLTDDQINWDDATKTATLN